MLEPWCEMPGLKNECWDQAAFKWGPCEHYDGKEYGVYAQSAQMPTNPLDKQVGGDHYKKAAMQPIEYIQANGLTFCEGNAVKYITRHRMKGGKADLEKAIHYLQLEIAHSYGST